MDRVESKDYTSRLGEWNNYNCITVEPLLKLWPL